MTSAFKYYHSSSLCFAFFEMLRTNVVYECAGHENVPKVQLVISLLLVS